jgi:uncharacterized protein (DUF433 family)/DNA-binding transcriptional MerR regulator
MKQDANKNSPVTAIGIGCYTTSEAARLLKIQVRNVNRWLRGYSYNNNGITQNMSPLWRPQFVEEGHIELSFKDLIELKFVKAFLDAGVKLHAIRLCHEKAQRIIQEDHPFLTRKFKTDGKTIYMNSLSEAEENSLLDLKNNHYNLEGIIQQTFKSLDVDNDVVVSWRPFKGKKTIVVDPQRSFGQPIVHNYGVPTTILAQAAEAEGSLERVAKIFDVTLSAVKDAVKFEEYLLAA